MIDPQKKWDTKEKIPIDLLLKKIEELEFRVKVLEEENIGTTNTLYEIQNKIDLYL
jgi:hypothetical protein